MPKCARLALYPSGRLHQEAVHRRNEACRISDRAHPLPGCHTQPDGTDAAHHRQERKGATGKRSQIGGRRRGAVQRLRSASRAKRATTPRANSSNACSKTKRSTWTGWRRRSTRSRKSATSDTFRSRFATQSSPSVLPGRYRFFSRPDRVAPCVPCLVFRLLKPPLSRAATAHPERNACGALPRRKLRL